MKKPILIQWLSCSFAIAFFTFGQSTLAQQSSIYTVEKYPSGRALVSDNKRYWLIDAKGDKVGNQVWDGAKQSGDKFRLIRVLVQDSILSTQTNTYQKFDRPKTGLLNRATGEVIAQPIYDVINEFFDGKAIVKNEKLSGMIAADGSVTVPLKYDNIRRLENGNYVFVEKTTGHFFDRQLMKIVSVEGVSSMQPTKMKCVYTFTKDSAAGYIDCNGNWSTNKEWREVDKIENNLVFVITKKVYGIYHLAHKKMLFEPVYDRYEYNPDANVLLLRKNNEWLIADTTGKTKPGWQGDNIIRFTKGNYFYRNNQLWGIVHPATGKVVAATWANIEGVPGELYFKAMLPGQDWLYYDLKGRKLNHPDEAKFRLD